MAIINLVSFIFYIVAAMSLAIAVPIPTTMPEGSGEAITEPYSNDTNITTTEAMASIPSVPAFQCQAGVDYSQSMWSLFNGLTRVTYYFNSPRTTVCPEELVSESIRQRIQWNADGALPLQVAASILQAYSEIALLSTSSQAVPESTRGEMQIAHELLNGLLQNYYEVITPSHCSCPGSNSANCVEISDLSQRLDLTTYPSSCSPADYFLDTFQGDLQLIYTKFRSSSELTNVISQFDFNPGMATCQTWKDNYLAADSQAYSLLTC